MRLHASRIPIALLIATLFGASIGGSMGLVSAAGDKEIDEFSVAMPMADDRWSYDLVAFAQIDDDEPDTDQAQATYDYGATRPWQSPEGKQHVAVAVMEQLTWDGHEGRNVEEAEYLIDAHDGRALGAHGSQLLNWTQGAPAIVGLPTITPQSTQVQVEAETFIYAPMSPFCGLRSELQSETPISLHRPIALTGTCFPDAEDLGFPTDPQFQATGVQSLDGRDVVHFESVHGNTTTEVWFAPDVPYPVRIDARTTQQWAPFGGPASDVTLAIQWTMVGFEAGTEPFDLNIDLPPDVSVAPIELAPRQVWGPDDQGVDHVYKLSEAFRGALVDPAYPDLRDFMQAHPEAAVVDAEHHQEEQDDGSVDHVWRFVVKGDNAVHETTARRNVPAPGTPQELLGGLAGTPDSHRNTGGTFLSLVAFFYPAPDQLPSHLPTVASMLARYDDLRDNEGNAWEWDSYCFFECSVALYAGHSERIYEEGDVTGDGAKYTGSEHVLQFNEAGDVLALRLWDEEGQTTTGVAPSPTVSSQPTMRTQIAMSALVWQAPPPEAVASAGFLGLLIGALYWLWPTLKALPFFGMFSRISKDELLDHPIRQSLRDHVEAKPGVHYQALVQHLGRGRGVIEHHLRKLEAGGVLQSKRTKGYTCYYVKGKLDNRVMEALPAIKSATASTILQTIIERPGTTAKELSAAIGISPSTASHHISKLRQVGLLDASGTRNAQLLPTGIARDAMAARMT